MNYNKLGKTDIKVSELGFGAWSIALDWWGKKIEEDEAKRMLKKACHSLSIHKNKRMVSTTKRKTSRNYG